MAQSFGANILVDAAMRAKISDFGLSKHMPSLPPGKSYAKVKSFRGTRGYAADEYFQDHELSPKLDVFSFGVVSKSNLMSGTCTIFMSLIVL